MITSEKIECLAKALTQMQGAMGIASKDRSGYNYKYADLASVWGVIREPLVSNGLSVLQDAITIPEGVSVTTRVMHDSGQWIEFGPLVVPMGKKDAHSTGSAITYAKRYALCAALGVVTDDDDGAAAQKSAPVALKRCSQKDYDNFLTFWSQSYDKNMLNLYIDKKSAHHNMHPLETVFVLMNDLPKFEREFNNWESKQQKLPPEGELP